MTVEELEKAAEAKASKPDEFEDSDGEFDLEEQLVGDLTNSFSLLKQCMHLLDYIADVEFCKTITKRERVAMERLSQKVCEFLDATEGQYEGDV